GTFTRWRRTLPPMSTYREAPHRTWPDHGGRACEDAIYHVPPDPRVGEVLTAWSNQTKTGFHPMPAKALLGLAVIAGVLALLLGGGTVWLLDRLRVGYGPEWLPYLAWGLVALI